MEFQFPASPESGDSVLNPSTGVHYVWTAPPGQWRVKNIARANVSVYEGTTAPPPEANYSLWFNTLTNTLLYYYCPPDENCQWVSTAFNEDNEDAFLDKIQTLSDAIIELHTKVNVLENTSFILME